MKARRGRRAFTLIELLTVIAITAILLTIIIIPVFQSFQITRTAQAFADAQDRARVATERIAREIGNSSGVRDLTGMTVLAGTAIRAPRHSIAVTVPSVNTNGTPLADNAPMTQVILPYAKLDMFLPAEGEETLSGPTDAYTNPITGKKDPTLRAPQGSPRLPAAPGNLWVRYFIGLREPVRTVDGQLQMNPYRDPYTGLLQSRSGERDNLYALWKVEFVPRENGAWNGSLFTLDANGLPTDLDDPAFFAFIPGVDTTAANSLTLTASGVAKAKRMLRWMGENAPGETLPVRSLGKATMVTEVSRYDMIMPLYDKASRRVKNTNGVPNLVALAQFRPTRVDNDQAVGQTAVRLGEETLNAAALVPDVYTTRFGLWSDAFVRVWPTGYNQNDSQNNEYEIGRPTNDGFVIFAIDPDSGANNDEMREGIPLFSQSLYENSPNFPFSRAVNVAALNTRKIREVFVPFFTIPSKGKVIASFTVSEVGTNGTAPNLPRVQSGPAEQPDQAANPNASSLSPYPNVANYTINGAFNRLWAQYPELRGQLHRFIDLRPLPTEDGTLTPLFPNYIAGTATGFTREDTNRGTTVSRVFIVPGSEEVFGPDQLDGPNYGQRIRYVRVNGEPGPNQYRINYTDLPEPEDYTLTFGSAAQATPPPTYLPGNVTSAVLQPRFRAGYIQLNSNPTSPLPDGAFQVSYRFQFTGGAAGSNQPGDRLAVDYDTRQLISVLLTMRNYPQASVPNPQSVTLKATATVRNYVR
jgi:prepilin-type N-terminal cleavage/methylation domain-containing protein